MLYSSNVRCRDEYELYISDFEGNSRRPFANTTVEFVWMERGRGGIRMATLPAETYDTSVVHIGRAIWAMSIASIQHRTCIFAHVPQLGTNLVRSSVFNLLCEPQFKSQETRRNSKHYLQLKILGVNLQYCIFNGCDNIEIIKKSKVAPLHCHEDIRGIGGTAPPFLTSVLNWGEWLVSRPCHLISGKPPIPITQETGHQNLSACCGEEKSLMPLPRINPDLSAFHPVS
jgi:hypothetical protein